MITSRGFKLSAQQERIWAQQGLSGLTWQACAEVLLLGEPDRSRLRAAVAHVVQRHEILRTVFHQQPGLKVPFQVIRDEHEFGWCVVDRTAANESVAHSQVEECSSGNLEQGPLLRVTLVMVGPQRYRLVFSLPAMCADAVSLRNLIVEVREAYEFQNLAGGEVLQYVDVAQWQDDLINGEEGSAGRQYWREYCSQIEPSEPPALPYHSVPDAEFQPAGLAWEVHQTSNCPREFLLTCWWVFLARMCGRSELTVGCDAGVRKYDELTAAIGPLATFLPVRFLFDPDASLASHVEQTQAALEQALHWQESFSWANSCDVEARPAAPSFGFEYADLPPDQSADGVLFSAVRIESCSEKFDLKLLVRRKQDKLFLALYYDAARLELAAVEAWREHFTELLISALSDASLPAWRLPLLSSVERNRLTLDWNRTEVDYPRDSCIFELIEQQAARTPERAAVRCEGETLSYRELNEQANQLAHALRKSGAGPNEVVGLCLPRGPEMITGLLGILKAGAAYTAVSADLPRERIMAQLAGAVALVTQQKFLPELPVAIPAAICLDTQAKLLDQQPRTNPDRVTGPEDLVYVLYTSGSTGVPKGVAVRHRNLVNYSCHISRMLTAESVPGGLQFATVSTLSADLGNTCIFPSLITGGCLHIIPSDIATDAERFRARSNRQPIDVLKIVPSHLAALLNAGGGRAILPRKFLILGGEAFSTRLLQQIRALEPECEIFNHYGPTETTIGSLTLRLRDYNPVPSTKSVPIGRPIANTQVYVLDDRRQPVPPGIVGELYIGGDGVSAGYLNQPHLTGERFVPDPFGPGAHLYRTGDLVRYLRDGNLEFLGRTDDQVKIRGFRVELGEIQSALLAVGPVAQSVVLARPDTRGDLQLIAYVAPRIGVNLDPEALSAALKLKLPEYMIPAAITVLPRFPLNANGKLDRQKLPPPEMPLGGDNYLEPQTVTEAVIAGIWSEVLGRKRIGANDNFFEIGGHSLLATQVISRIRRSLEVDPPLGLIFESPTVSGLAAWIDRARRTGQGLSLPTIKRVSRDRQLPLSFAQQRLWVVDQLDPDNPLYNVPRRVRMRGLLNVDAFRSALNEIVRRHESLRTTFRLHAGEPVQTIHDPAPMRLTIQDLSDLPATENEEAARRIALEEAQLCFDLVRGPLVRGRLLRLAPEEHVFLLTCHHIISDRWSATVFMRELGIVYGAFLRSEPSPLPEPALQYADFAIWQRQWLQGDALASLLAYWRDQLRGAPPVLSLPTDHPRSSDEIHDGAAELVWLPAELLTAIESFSRREDVTPFMTLLAGFQLLLSRLARQEHIVVGTDVANRTTLESESLIGFFINLLPLHTDLSGDPSFRELSQRVRRVALGAYAHQDMPFDKLVEEVHPDRTSRANPLIQVLFVMLNTPSSERSFPGLELSEFEVPLTRSKFDLALFVLQREDRLATYWVYRTRLFERETIHRWSRYLERLLINALADPGARVSTLDMLSEEEKQQRDAEDKVRKQSQLRNLRVAQPKMADLTLAGLGEG